jgi:phage gp36-like protein
VLTLSQFLERHDAQLIAQLTDPNAAAVDSVKVQRALDDSMGVIDGYTYRLPTADVPPASTLDAHQARIALALLAGNRPGELFDSIRDGHATSVTYLERLSSSEPKAADDVAFDAPPALFDDGSLKSFGDLGGES